MIELDYQHHIYIRALLVYPLVWYYRARWHYFLGSLSSYWLVKGRRLFQLDTLLLREGKLNERVYSLPPRLHKMVDILCTRRIEVSRTNSNPRPVRLAQSTIDWLALGTLSRIQPTILSTEHNILPITHTVTDTGRYSSYCSTCLLYTSPSPRDKRQYRMPSSA